MDPTSALADLTEISSQIDDAVVLLEDGSVLASTIADEERARRLATTALELLAAAAEVPHGARELAQLEVALGEGSVFVVRDGGRLILATAVSGAPSGLVLYDLRACLRSLDESGEETNPPPRKRTTRTKTAADA